MKTYVTALLAAGALALAMGISEPAQAGHGWHGGHWHGGWGGRGWGWRGWGWRGWGPRVGIYVGPRVYASRRCWSKRYGWVPCRWYY
jgi:hypothetical protein